MNLSTTRRKIAGVDARMVRDNEIHVRIYDLDGVLLGQAVERTGRVFGGLHEVFPAGAPTSDCNAAITRTAGSLREAAHDLLRHRLERAVVTAPSIHARTSATDVL